MAIRGLVVLCAFLGLAAVQAASVLPHLGTRLIGLGSDPLLVTWILAWDVHALGTRALRLFDANLAFPLERSLAFSDHLLGVLPLFAPVYLLTGNPVAAHNVVLLLSGALSAAGAAALAWCWTGRWGPAIVAGTLFGWAPLRLSQVGHLQLLTFFWAPLALAFLERFLRGRRTIDLAAFALCYWLQVLSSFYLGVMITVGVVAYVVASWRLTARAPLGRSGAAGVAAFLVASLVVLLPPHWPYLEVHRAWQAAWTPGAMAGYSADLQSYLSAPPAMNDLYVAVFRPVTPLGAHERLLFPGLVLPALALLGTLGRVGEIPADRVRGARRLFAIVALVGFVLSLGPYLVVWGVNTRIPLPYLGLYYLVPGWSAMRVPARFAFLLLLAMVPLSALGAQILIERAAAVHAGLAWRRLAPALVVLALVGSFLLELGGKPLPTQPVVTGAAVPEVYRWLARERPGPLVEVPIDPQGGGQEYLYLSTTHWLPLVNGRSGFAPSSHDEVKLVLAELPGRRAREYAAALGLRALVVHGDRLTREEQIRWAAAESAGHVRRLATFGTDVVYGVDPAPATGRLGVGVEAPDALPAGADVRLGLRLTAEASRPWAQGRPHGLARATVRWTELGTGRATSTTTPLLVPLVVAAGESVAVPLRLTAPASGRYDLDVTLEPPGISTGRRTLEVRDRAYPATSVTAPDRLAARYVVEATPGALGPADSFRLRLVAINTGEAVWLTKARGGRGDVALEWRWLDAGGRALPGPAGRAPIRHDVYPGQRHEFDEWPAPPVDAGAYVLEVGLATGGVGPFGVGSPARIGLEIEGAARGASRP